MTPTIVTLTGFLGQDREVRYTRERTYLQTYRNEVAEMDEVREVTVPAREFLRFSLACRRGQETVWHRLVVWSPDERGFRNARMGRKGDMVTVTGSFETYEYTVDGVSRSLTQFVVETYKLIRIKIRHLQG